MGKILVIDDMREFREEAREMLESFSYSVMTFEDGGTAWERICDKSLDLKEYDAMLLDYRMTGKNGVQILQAITSHQNNSIPVIMMTIHDELDIALKCLDLGAWDFCVKDPNWKDINLRIRRAVDTFQRLQAQRDRANTISSAYSNLQNDNIPSTSPFSGIVGNSNAMLKLYRFIEIVSQSDATVLLTGESGTGKELIARQIHKSSKRNNGPFVAVNCGALAETLLESELFGHEKGAFTGAISKKRGKFELADGGTIFLDEIAEITPNFQVKLLRVLQQSEFERVGGETTKKINARVIAATNKDIEKLVGEGKFREDLFYRLNVIQMCAPPLRNRTEDIPLLVKHFVARQVHTVTNETPIEQVVTSQCISAMESNRWKGNVRELENLVNRTLVMTQNKLPLGMVIFSQQNDNLAVSEKFGERLFPECKFLEIQAQLVLVNVMLHFNRWGTDSSRKSGSEKEQRGLPSCLTNEFGVESNERGNTINWLRVGKQAEFHRFQEELLTKFKDTHPEEGEHKLLYQKEKDAIRRAVIAADFLVATFKQHKSKKTMLAEISYPATPLTAYDVSNRMNLTTLRLLGIIDSPEIILFDGEACRS